MDCIMYFGLSSSYQINLIQKSEVRHPQINLIHCGLVMPHGIQSLSQQGSVNGL